MAHLPPLTPAPSSEIAAKANMVMAHLESIALPPAAVSSSRSSVSSSANSDSSYRPPSPTSPVATLEKRTSQAGRKRSSAAADFDTAAGTDYALPPPPTRSRKIIQMKPQTSRGKQRTRAPASAPAPTPTPAVPPSPSRAATVGGHGAASTGKKKKQAGGSTVAGRKIARKTAHSLIERRRRSKMNEEFGMLKDMIPACAGQDMHKLAILQASVDYMRYLESCVAELKAAHRPVSGDRTSVLVAPPPRSQATSRSTPSDGFEHEDESDNEDMADTPPASTADYRRYTDSSAGRSHSSGSPAIQPFATTWSLSSNDPSGQSVPQQPFSNLPSPTSLAQQQRKPQPRPQPSSSLPSSDMQARQDGTSVILPPITGPVAESLMEVQDYEATASALLMLNTDRRAWGGRGISVKDLVSSQ